MTIEEIGERFGRIAGLGAGSTTDRNVRRTHRLGSTIAVSGGISVVIKGRSLDLDQGIGFLSVALTEM
jgi:hypothetical protein